MFKLLRLTLAVSALIFVVSCASVNEFNNNNEPVKTSIYLEKDEIALFGYGSLVNIESMEKTLRHKYTGPIILTYLKGWKRDWDVVMPNSYFYEETHHGKYFPKYIVYLNVGPSKEHKVYGALFVIKKKELNGFKEREWIYNFKDIGNSIENVKVFGGGVYTCIAKKKYKINSIDDKTMAIRKSYIKMVKHAYLTNGKSSLEEYYDTSEKIPEQIVINDKKNKEAKNPFGYKK
ncbi:MAG TPA: hypothetical protein QF753_04245 [Victivallales bacterium]|nr:hypothetical protein [Victivallales bacterium]